MRKNNITVSIILILIIVIIACTKKTNNATIKTSTPTQSISNHYSFDIGTIHYSTSDNYGQQYFTSDTILSMNFYNTTDTISGGFSLHAPQVGTYYHTNSIGNTINCFVINFGNPSSPNSTFYSKSGTLNITDCDIVNQIYSGTFSGVMYLSSNPSQTISLTNGSFYYKN